MEKEYKWSVAEPAFEALLGSVKPERTIKMEAVYFDTPDALLSKLGAGLRLRSENGENICCLKLQSKSKGACKTREEFEIPAVSLQEGLKKLPEAGAPESLCKTLSDAALEETCRTSFTRAAVTLRENGMEAELAFDKGFLSAGKNRAPLLEIELELKKGDEAFFDTFCQKLEKRCHLTPQPLSKLARALRLRDTKQ